MASLCFYITFNSRAIGITICLANELNLVPWILHPI